MTQLSDVVEYLDSYLGVGEVPDWPHALNGLQVDNAGTVSSVVAAVDACQATIDLASEARADLMLVHHGLFWRGLEPLVGRQGRRIRTLVESGIALYSAHLPLDVHGEVGNNVVLARMLGINQDGRFGELQGIDIGVIGTVSMTRGELLARIKQELGADPHVIAGGPADVRRVGIISGGAGDMIRQAAEAGCDTYVTGEGAHHTYFDAEELGINVIYAGHYATETVGVKALASHLHAKFDLPWQFVDHPTGL